MTTRTLFFFVFVAIASLTVASAQSTTRTLEFYGPLSEIYDGVDNMFFESEDTVSVSFVGEVSNKKMLNGYAEIKSQNQTITFSGTIVDGTMFGDNVEVLWVKSDSTSDYYKGHFDGIEFDSCFYASGADEALYFGKMSGGMINDDDAVYMGPLHNIYDGDISAFVEESQFLNYSPEYFDNNDQAFYSGSMRNGKVAETGNLTVIHDEDTLRYSGEFENATIQGVGALHVGNFYSYLGYFNDGRIAGMGELSSEKFSSVLTENELIPNSDGALTIKGIWAGASGLSEYFKVIDGNGDEHKFRVDKGEIKELNFIQKVGNAISDTKLAEWLEEYDSEFQKYLTGAAILNAGVCVSSLIPQAAPITGPICGIGFFGITGFEAAKLTILAFRHIDKECYTEDCIESTWKNYGKEQFFNVGLIAMPLAVGSVAKAVAPSLKTLTNSIKMSRYAKAAAASKNAEIVAKLEKLPEIKISRAKEIDIVNDHLALKQAVLDHTGKNFRDGFVEFFIRLKKSGREDLIEEIWKNHKTFIKNSGIRAGGVHEWLEAENFVNYLLNPKWGNDGAYLAYTLTKMTQPTTEVLLKNGGAHTIINSAGKKIPGPNSGRFHKDLGKKIESCSDAGCIFTILNEFARKTLTTQSFEGYVRMERAVLQ